MSCSYCQEGNPRVRSSVPEAFVHTDTPVGRVLCNDSPALTAERNPVVRFCSWCKEICFRPAGMRPTDALIIYAYGDERRAFWERPRARRCGRHLRKVPRGKVSRISNPSRWSHARGYKGASAMRGITQSPFRNFIFGSLLGGVIIASLFAWRQTQLAAADPAPPQKSCAVAGGQPVSQL